MTSRKKLTNIAIIVAAIFLAWNYLLPSSPISSFGLGSSTWPVAIRESGEDYVEFSPLELPKKVSGMDGPKPEIRIAVLEHAGFHDGSLQSALPWSELISEVVGALLKTLDDIGANYTVYRESAFAPVYHPTWSMCGRGWLNLAPLCTVALARSDLIAQPLADLLTLGDGWRWHFEYILKPFLPNIEAPKFRGEFATHAKEERFDLVIHTSCDYSWRDRMPNWISDAFLVQHNMHILCIQHELENLKQRERDVWKEVVDEGRFTLMTLSPHTSRELARYVMKWEYETRDPSWRNVTVDTLIPVCFSLCLLRCARASIVHFTSSPSILTAALPRRARND